MTTKPLVRTTPHTIRATPKLIELCGEYARYYIRAIQGKIAEYRELQGEAVESDAPLVEARRQLARAQVVVEALETLQGELERIYKWHYEQMADIYRQTRLELGLERIEDDPNLHMVVKFTMSLLKRENPRFREDKFINYINN
jgi:hypothetical protein